MSADDRVLEVVRLIHGMVEHGGGEVAFVSLDDSSRDLTVSYRASAVEACSISDPGSCAVSADMIGTFLQESLQSKGLKIGKITVKPTE